MGKRFRAVVEGTQISKHRAVDVAVLSVLDHIRGNEHLLPVGRKLDCWVALGEDVVVDIAVEAGPRGISAALEWNDTLVTEGG